MIMTMMMTTTTMAHGVCTFTQIFMEHGGVATEGEAAKYLRQLETAQRFQCEAWA